MTALAHSRLRSDPSGKAYSPSVESSSACGRFSGETRRGSGGKVNNRASEKNNAIGVLVVGLGSLVAGTLAQLAGLPAAWLVAPMLVAIIVALTMPRYRPEVPIWARLMAQAVVGCVLAASFVPAIVPVVASEWPAVSLALSGTLAMSFLGAFFLSRYASIDKRTARLGVLPGAASGILAMSESLDADVRLVAIMQYGRIILVVASATAIASLGGFSEAATRGTVSGGPSNELLVQGSGYVYALTGVVALVGMLAGVRLRLPAGALLGPLVLGIALEEAGIVHVAVPGVVSPVAYALIGIYAGLLFDRASLRQAWRLLPFMFASTLALMVACAMLGWVFAVLTNTDYLTAYLATTPGAIDSVAIIAVDSGADVSLVLAVQILRVFVVVAVVSVFSRI